MSDTALTREQVREVDRRAIHEHGIKSLDLMERAATRVADQAVVMLDGDAAGKHVLIICGGGNNGGDGFAAGRLLVERGATVTAVMLKPRKQYGGDAYTNLQRLEATDARVVEPADEPVETLRNVEVVDLMIDAIFGTGLDDTVRRREARVIQWMNGQRPPVLAVDIPSGLNADTGGPLGTAVEADCTVTFIADKVGFNRGSAWKYTGKVIVADIGVPEDIVTAVAPLPSEPADAS